MQNRKGGHGGAGASQGTASSALAVIEGTLFSVLITFIGSALFGIVLSLTEWEGTPITLQSVNYLSIAVGGLFAGRVARKAGWLHGGLVGLTYMLLATLIMSGTGIAALGVLTIAMRIVAGFAVGALGGMLGVNSR